MRAAAAASALLACLALAACGSLAPAVPADGSAAPAAPAYAAAAALAARQCQGVPAAVAVTSEVDADRLLRDDPAAALASACALRLHAEPRQRAAALLQMVAVFVERGRYADASALLEAVRPDVPDSGVFAAEFDVAVGTLALAERSGADAAAAFERAAATLQAAGATRTRTYAVALLGSAHGLRERHGTVALERADRLLGEASRVLQDIGLADSRDMVDVVNARTVLAYAREDLPAAVGYAREEIALMQRLGAGEGADVLDAYASLGSLLSQMARFEEAGAALREGLRLSDRLPGVAPTARLGLLNNTAGLESELNRFPAALAAADAAVAFATSAFGERSARLVVPLNHRAQALFSLSRLAESQATFERALVIARQQQAQVGALRRLRLLENLVALQVRLNDATAASALLDEAMTIAAGNPELGYWRGRLVRLRGALLAADGRWQEADTLYREAGPLIAGVVGERSALVGHLRAARCLAQVQGRLGGSACNELESAVALAADSPAMLRFSVANALAQSADAEGRRSAARGLHLRALSAAKSLGTPYPLWVALDALAVHMRQVGEPAAAVALGKQAITQVELVRSGFTGAAQVLDAAYIADKHAVYRRVAGWLTDDGRVTEALEVLRLLQREEFLDFVRGEARAAAAERPGVPPTPREADWFERWFGAAPQAGEPRDDDSQARQWQSRLEGAPRLPVARAELRLQLPAAERPAAGVAVVWVYEGSSGMNLVVDSLRGRLVQRLAVDPLALRRDIGWALADIAGRKPDMALLRSLHARVGAPIEHAARQAGARRLVMNLDGALRYLPFAALHDGRGFLSERFTIEQRAGTGPAPQAARRASFVQAFAVTRAFDDMPALPAAADEVCGIVAGPVEGLDGGEAGCARARRPHGVMPGRAWVNQSFTLARLTQAALQGSERQRDVLHVGSHFMLRPGNVAKSWLLMGDGHRLPLGELALLDMRQQDIVTLSACETGLGGSALQSPGAEVQGLAALMMSRGAGSVVASLWRVEDASTSLLLQALYLGLEAGLEPAEALRRAQASLRDAPAGAYRHPFYWAGFYVAVRGV